MAAKTSKSTANTKWFTEDRFGMFIHWGSTRAPARVGSQQGDNSNESYQKNFDRFNPISTTEGLGALAREAA
jgi:alpha-L-fucosidase